MLIDKTHYRWGIGTAVAFVLATLAYVAYAALSVQVSGGTVVGLTFGILALLCMSLAGLLAVRKSFPTLRVGSAQFWLRAHIWLGLLSIPLTLFHTNFRWGGALELTLMACFALVILSGIHGLLLQQILPRHMKLRVPQEASIQQLAQFCKHLQRDGDALVADFTRNMLRQEKAAPAKKKAAQPAAALATAAAKSQPPAPAANPVPPSVSTAAAPRYKMLLVFYETDVRAFLDGDTRKAAQHKLASESYARQRFRQFATVLSPESIPTLHRLERICDERRGFLVQLRIHHWLHNWLLVHVPLSAALFVLLTAHVVMALRVVPWSF